MMTLGAPRLEAALLGALLTAGLTLPRPAAACGGFFCSQQQPVVQLGERIIFISLGDGRTTAVVQIQYSGPSERFSWVVPVPGVPEVGVSSNMLFTRLQQATDPQWTLADTVEGRCAAPPQSSDASAGGADAGSGGVTIIDSGAVGPYDYQVIQLDAALPNPADVAVRWLGDNGYDVGGTAPELLGGYLSAGMNLLAFRLQKDRGTGDIRPVTMTYRSALPMIPIKLTAVATAPDLGVATWIAGPARAVPTNYRTVEVNEARIDWVNRGFNYLSLLGAAVDEAGGQAMVTEYAQPTDATALNLWTQSDDATWMAVRDRDYSGREAALVRDVMFAFNGWDGMSAVLSRLVVPRLGGSTLLELQGCPTCILPGQGAGPLPGLDAAAFLAAIDAEVVRPLRDVADSLTRRAYLTRLYTSLSADEMTVDPTFAWNTTLPTVSNVHTRARTVQCSPALTVGQAPWTIELLDGVSLSGTGQSWPAGVATLPAAARVLQLSDTGPGTVVVDNLAAIRAGVLALIGSGPGPIDAGVPLEPLPPRPTRSSSSCQSTGESSGLMMGMGLVGAALWLARRRTARPQA
jgi:uncharacterized protein (TIGR03382 family)